ncbi:MAG TPA: efflux RND transporter permease subunit, partial [Chthoniobacteraceae bacterium]|nr:efflux RND transporter permease subunit [Chthoniobacteraceae bacterium]
FIPVFSLTAQEGRLFRPLAFTKTFAMFFAAFLGVTLVPVLMVWLIRGKIVPESRNPVNRFLIWAYQPLVNFALRHRWPLLIATGLIMIAFGIIPAINAFFNNPIPFYRWPKEFMPPLNEGDILYMPTAVPGISINEATKILQIQDRMLRKIPEVATVFGKAGQSETPTDPAPLSMFETVVQLKPPNEWRPGMTWEKIIAEMNANIKTPGMANIFWMPIQTRTEMLTTGFRTVLGVKVFGPDLKQIENVAVAIEKALSDFPDTRSAFAERTTGGYFLDFNVNRQAAARYGLRVGDVNDIIETAIGGKTIATTVEGRERYPISVRYARDFREDLDALRRVLVPTRSGDASSPMVPAAPSPPVRGEGASRTSGGGAPPLPHIPISMLADINYKTGPPSIRNENGQLVGFVFVDVTTSDIAGYVEKASARLRERVQFPPGYYIQWAGQFEYLKAAEKRLAILIPFTLVIIFVLIFMNTQSVTKTVIVLLAVPFSLVGAFWTLYLLGYNMSVAVWVGLIALAGLDAETGVVMLLYLDHAWEKYVGLGRMNSMADLYDAVKEGAVQRIRPKIMTVCAILFGLLPIMWSPTTQAGADVMKRIAAPMIGGVVTSAILELLIYPVIFVIWRRRALPAEGRNVEAEVSEPAPAAPAPARGARRVARFFITAAIVALLAGGGWFVWEKFGSQSLIGAKPGGAPFANGTVNGLTVSFRARDGGLRVADNDVIIEFRNAAGESVDVGDVKLELTMNMPGMTMRSAANVQRTSTAGQYRAKVKPDMAGDWSATLSFDGPQGKGETTFAMNARP